MCVCLGRGGEGCYDCHSTSVAGKGRGNSAYDSSVPTCDNYLKAGKVSIRLFYPLCACGLRNCRSYTGSLIGTTILQGRKYLQFTYEEADSQKLRKVNFDKIRRHVRH